MNVLLTSDGSFPVNVWRKGTQIFICYVFLFEFELLLHVFFFLYEISFSTFAADSPQ